VPGDGRVGALLVADRRTAGVAFTGSTEVARAINRALAAKDRPIVPLIAETGGINAHDRRRHRAARAGDRRRRGRRASVSAGQRCSACACSASRRRRRPRDQMIAGAARELALGDPREIADPCRPVIDAEAKTRLDGWIADMESQGRVGFRWDRDRPLPTAGTYVPPAIVALDRARDLRRRCSARSCMSCGTMPASSTPARRPSRANGYGLTLGIHSRIDATVARIRGALAAWQCLRQPQHDRRRGGTSPSVEAASPAPDPRRAARIICAVCLGAGGHDQHRGGRAATRVCCGRRVSVTPASVMLSESGASSTHRCWIVRFRGR